MQSKIEKVTLVLAGISILGVAVWWWVHDFYRAGLAEYLPFLIPPVVATVFWYARERRLDAQELLWESVMNPFPNRYFPGGILDPKRHGIGWMEVHGGVKLGAVLSLPGDDGIYLQMATNAGRFRGKLLPWEEIARVTFMKIGTLRNFGAASLGFAAIQFTTPRDLKMVIPWRETFSAQIPDRLGFQEVDQTASTNK